MIFKTLWITLLMTLLLGFRSSEDIYEASYYSNKFQGRKTASGQTFSNQEFMCATGKEYAFNTIIRVTNTKNNKSVDVWVADRGGFSKSYPKRKVDLSQRAFKAISKDGTLKEGILNVKITVITTENNEQKH